MPSPDCSRRFYEACGGASSDRHVFCKSIRGRISVFRGVEVAIMRKEKMPATIAPESFQAEESFVALLTPVLAWPLEAALGLPTGGLDGSAANGLAPPPARAVIHPVLMLVKIIDLFLYRFRCCSRWQFRQNLFQARHDFDGGLVFELLHQGAEPTCDLR